MAFEREREDMVSRQLEARGIRDARVLDAMRRVPRERFVAAELAEHAHDDTPLPIGERQTISQPYMVALMSEALDLRGAEPRVLEVGTGSGYQAAVLAAMGARVLTIERLPALAARARAVLAELGLDERVRVLDGDGTLGWPDEAPYDGIVITAGAPQIPASAARAARARRHPRPPDRRAGRADPGAAAPRAAGARRGLPRRMPLREAARRIRLGRALTPRPRNRRP